jgi:hypothetical protein
MKGINKVTHYVNKYNERALTDKEIAIGKVTWNIS